MRHISEYQFFTIINFRKDVGKSLCRGGKVLINDMDSETCVTALFLCTGGREGGVGTRSKQNPKKSYK